MGTARSLQIARERAAEADRQFAVERQQRELRRKQELYEAQLVTLKGQYETERDVILRELDQEKQRQKVMTDQRLEIARLRKADDNGDVQAEENGIRKARKGTAR